MPDQSHHSDQSDTSLPHPGAERPSDAVWRSGLARAPSRRSFLGLLGAGTAAMGLLPSAACAAVSEAAGAQGGPATSGFRAISSGNGLKAVELALKLAQGDDHDLLSAAVAGVGLVEDDPRDMSVGYGGLPNEDGVVELDAAVMDGATHRAGAVGALQGVRHPAAVALRIMQRTDHVMLAGEGARRFATAHGFPQENLLTDAARKRWLSWKEQHSVRDDWLPSTRNDGEVEGEDERPTGTIHLALRDAAGHLACTTTTSGLAYKIPGRVGDSALIGHGLYCTDEVGSCGSTGLGEAVILDCGSFAVVEAMRRGASPLDACLEVLARIARHAPSRRRRADGSPDFDVQFYAMHKDGRYAGAHLRPGGQFAVADVGGARKEDLVSL